MNHRPHHSKAFGNRSYDSPNPWMSEEEIFNLRRQTSQFHNVMQNVPSAIHPYLNQNVLSSSASKNFMNQNLCNVSNINFTHTPNPEIFKPPHSVTDSNFTNRLIGDRFQNTPYSHAKPQHKLNDDIFFKDLTPSHVSHQFPKNDGFSENPQKLFSNIQSPVERFSCMQKDQIQFNRKYEDSQIFQGKDFPFNNKDMQSHLPVSFIDKVAVSIGSNFPSCKSNYKAPSLFPAYTSKDNNEIPFQRSQSVTGEISKNIHQSAYGSDYSEKVGSNYCDKPQLSARYAKAPESFSGKTESFQERDVTLNETFPQNNPQSYLHEKSSFKPISNSPMPQDSLKALENSVSSTNSKFPFSTGNLDTCFQSSNEISFQTSQSMQIINNSNSSTVRDCLMQNVPFSGSGTSLNPVSESTTISSQFNATHQNSKEVFSTFDSSSQSNVHQNSFNVTSGLNIHPSTKETFSFAVTSQPNVQQNSKESFSTFNFEVNMSTTDISDLVPGLDAFLKEPCKPEEAVHKTENINLKNDLCKTSVSNCAFEIDDDESKHSIPFIHDSQVSNNSIENECKTSYCDQNAVKNKFEFVPEKSSESKLAVNNESNISTPVKTNSEKADAIENVTPKVQSALEEAIELLVKDDAIVGLDYITEYKKSISQEGSFPFRCKLCNSYITRPNIIDHIIGSKHRMKYVKTKNESTYEYLASLKVEKAEKDSKIAEAAFHMELVYGRGHVTVIEDDPDETNPENKSKEVEDQIEEPVFTLDKIPIGFEALSPQHEEMDATTFPLESDLNPIKHDVSQDTEKQKLNVSVVSEVNKDITVDSKIDSVLKLPGLEDEDPSHCNADLQFAKLTPEVNTEICKIEKDENNYQSTSSSSQVKRCLSPQPYSVKTLKTDYNEKSVVVKNEESVCDDKKAFMMDLLEEFSKSDISSHEEALMVLKIIGMFVQMLLRYDLPRMTVENLENMLSSLQVSSSEKNVVEDIKSLLKDYKFLDEIKEESKQKIESPFHDEPEENIKQKMSTNTENRNSDIGVTLYEPIVSVPNINAFSNNGSNLMLNTNLSLAVSETQTGINTVAQTAPSVAKNTTEVSKMISDNNVSFVTTCVNSQNEKTTGTKVSPFPDINVSAVSSSAVNTQTMNAVGLKPDINISTTVSSASQATMNTAGLIPPPFFSWSQKNETNPVSYANVQGTQNMMWSNAYQYSQPYAQMSYYQSQNYGNHYNGAQSYQSQFPIMTQPRAPPLPPPPPSNPPLPPSVLLPANPPLSVSFNQPPPPPPLH